MNNLLKKVFDRLLGINFSLGVALFVWLILSLIIETPDFNRKNIIFCIVSCAVPWIINFIFGYSSKLYMKGLLHGVLWFVIEMIIFNLMYGIALEAFVLMRVAGIYAMMYSAILFCFYRITSKLNIPVRHTAEFCGKLTASFKK